MIGCRDIGERDAKRKLGLQLRVRRKHSWFFLRISERRKALPPRQKRLRKLVRMKRIDGGEKLSVDRQGV
jgi:hypothetical protein